MMTRRLLIISFFCFNHVYLLAQNLNISSGWQILYNGYKNPVNITLDGYKRKNIVIKVEGGKLIYENNKSFIITDGSTRVLKLKAGIKIKGGKIKWIDSTTCRVRNIPREPSFLGTRADGYISKDELMNYYRLNVGLQGDFTSSPIIYTIHSYNLVIIGETIFYTVQAQGSEIPDEALNVFKSLEGGEVIYIYNIKATASNSETDYKKEVVGLPVIIRLKYENVQWNKSYPEYNIKSTSNSSIHLSTKDISEDEWDTLSLGNKNGLWKVGESFCGKDIILLDQEYRNDTLLSSTGYYPSGEVKFTAKAASAKGDGKYISYYRNGGIRFEGPIKESEGFYYNILKFK